MTDRSDLDDALRRMEERYGIVRDDDVPEVFIIRDRVVPTEWGDQETERMFEMRCGYDEFGEWQTEVIRDERGWRQEGDE